LDDPVDYIAAKMLFRAHYENLNKDRPIPSRQKCWL